MKSLRWFRKSVVLFAFLAATPVWANDEQQQVERVEKLQERIAMLKQRLRDVTNDKAALEKVVDEIIARQERLKTRFSSSS